MKSFKVLMVAATLCMVVFSACKKDDPVNNPENSGSQVFGIKTATVVYDFLGTNTLYFDNYGAQVCIDYDYGSIYIDNERYIMDVTAKKAYYLNTTAKTYKETTVAAVQDELSMYIFAESDFSTAGSGFTKTTETIAGKSCAVYTGLVLGSKTSMGGWNGILFVMTMNGSDWIRASAFSETVPANIFTVPSGYTKQTN